MHDFHYRDSDFFLFHLKEDVPIPEEFVPHTHPQRAELLCFISGKCKYKIEEASISLRPGDVILVMPNEIHQLEVDASIPYERICVNFRPEALTQMDTGGTLHSLLYDYSVGKKRVFRTSDFEGFVCSDHFYDMMEPTPNRHLTILANMIIILQKLSMIHGKLTQNDTGALNLEQEVVRYINENLHKPLSLETLCNRFFLSRAQLCRFFQEALGTSVGKYINAKRMVQAQKLILQGQRPSAVYSQCGYQNYTSFFRAYCKFFGHSPKKDALCGSNGIPYSSIQITKAE